LALPSSGFSDWEGTVGAGATYLLFDHLSFDYQIDRGLNRRAAEWTHTLRVNWEW
jgi:hypothetical protein